MTDAEYIAAAFRVVLQNRRAFRAGFEDWLWDNVTLQRAFDAEALKVAAAGRAHYSAYTIAEYLRHSTAFFERGLEFKLNNSWVSSMARLFSCMHPQHRRLFETRALTSVHE